MDVVRLPRLRRGEPVTVPAVRVLRHVADAARRRVGLVSRVRLREPGRVPVLRLLRDGPRPPGGAGPAARPAIRRTAVIQAPRATACRRGPGGPCAGRRPGRRPAPTARRRRPGWPAPPAGWGTPPPGWGPPPPRPGSSPAPPPGLSAARAIRSPGIRSPAYPPPGYPPPGWAAPVAQPGYPPPGLGRPAARMGRPARAPPRQPPPAGTPPGRASPPAGWAPPATPAARATAPDAAARRRPTPVVEPPVAAPPPPPAADRRHACRRRPNPSAPVGDPVSAVRRPRRPPPVTAAGRRHRRRPLDRRSGRSAPPQARHAAAGAGRGRPRPRRRTARRVPGLRRPRRAPTAAAGARRSGRSSRSSSRTCKGSTALTEQIDAEAINEVKERYFASMAAEIDRHGGKIEKYIGDAIMAVFGLPRAHEDDALRAVRAAHGMTVALDRLNEDLLAALRRRDRRTGPASTPARSSRTPTRRRAAPGDRRRRQRRRAPRAGRAGERGPHRRGHVQPRPRAGRGRGGRAARAQGQGRARPGLPADRRPRRDDASTPSVDRPDAPLVGPRRRSSPSSGPACARSSGAAAAGSSRVLGEAGVGKTYLVDAFLGEVGRRRTRAARPLPAVRRRHHLLAGRRDRARRRRHRGRRHARERPGRSSARCSSGVQRRGRDPRPARRRSIGLSSDALPGRRDLLGRPQVPRGAGARGGRSSLSSRTSTTPRRRSSTCSSTSSTRPRRQSAVLVVATGRLVAAREAAGVGRSRAGVHARPVPAARGRRHGAARRGAARRRRSTTRSGTGSSPRPRATRCSSQQLVSMLVDKGLVHSDDDGWTATGDLADRGRPADDPGAARRPPRRPVARGAGDHGAGLRHRPRRSPSRRSRSSCPSRSGRPCPAHLSALDRKQFLDRESRAAGEDEIYRFRNLHDQGRDLRVAAQAGPRASSTSGS